ncbi:hypothetical protein DCAR_0726916 [Daucus carota subsp. sativus]|uniref:Uncharacterized protein n=1 Tax=Daucus carota subsp. sativus TaxID=79200 RepID=A0A161ZK34_DAUCS|nr:hypothetical protein DCAR_0726916 [Daucus carota subsp. sativus]
MPKFEVSIEEYKKLYRSREARNHYRNTLAEDLPSYIKFRDGCLKGSNEEVDFQFVARIPIYAWCR